VARKKVVTSRYGWRKGRPHKGIDIDLITGDSVMAMLGGVVRFARYSSGHGKTVVIRHYNGLETGYMHLSKYAVKVNDTIQKGQVIGLGGTTGNARGSHLHLTVSYKGNYINPEYVFDFRKDNRIRNQNVWVTKHWVTASLHTSKKQSNLFFHTNYNEALASQKKQNRRQIYIVKKGDTLSRISNKYHISLAVLCKTNAISTNSILKIGKKLIIQ
jgi:murein DD-endopeptidase MepM/ murein hydrolase activator NlpD